MYVKLRQGADRVTSYKDSEDSEPTNYYGHAVTPTTLKPQSSILSMLHGRASLRPGEVAFTFTDYHHDSGGRSRESHVVAAITPNDECGT